MSTPLRVLIVEDRAADADLMAHELRRAGFEPQWKRVETEADYLAELQSSPDVILADHTLPQFSASRALDLVKERGLDIPVIVVTGSISEEVAVERLKQGAADYILKDRMARLGPAVAGALEEKRLRDEKRKAEEEVQQNLERIRALHDIDLAISSSLDLPIVLTILLEKIDFFVPFISAATVRLINPVTGALEPVACRNLDENEWKANEWKGGRGPSNIVLESKAPLVIAYVQTDPRIRDPEFFRRHKLISYLGIPLIAKGDVLGILGFYTKEEHRFDTEETEFLSTLAGQAAIAIYNARLYEEMARANKVKDEFLSVMSHELRTPLNVVLGYAGMIQEGMLGDVNQKQKEACVKILRRGQELLGMVNGILYATSLEAKAVKPEKHETNLADLLGQVRSACEVMLEKELKLNWDYPSELRLVTTDAAKLKHILQNLISNAIKFTEKGTVTVSARIREPWLEFNVADTGVGIAKEHLPYIFEKFRQVDSSETRLYGGVGLGLYVVKQFTELLGGTVEVQSEPGKGSTFTVRIPLSTSPGYGKSA